MVITIEVFLVWVVLLVQTCESSDLKYGSMLDLIPADITKPIFCLRIVMDKSVPFQQLIFCQNLLAGRSCNLQAQSVAWAMQESVTVGKNSLSNPLFFSKYIELEGNIHYQRLNWIASSLNLRWTIQVYQNYYRLWNLPQVLIFQKRK